MQYEILMDYRPDLMEEVLIKLRSRELTIPNPETTLVSSLSVDFDSSSLSKLNPRGRLTQFPS